MDADPKPIDATLLDDLRELEPAMAAKRLEDFIDAPPRVETDALAQDAGVIDR